MIKVRTEAFEKAIYLYGFYPALKLLVELEAAENYEACVSLRDAMINVSKGREYYLSMKTDPESIGKTLKGILKDRPNDFIEQNMPYYVDRFKEVYETNHNFK